MGAADNLILRFAASKAIASPNFSDMQAYQLLNVGTSPASTRPTTAARCQ